MKEKAMIYEGVKGNSAIWFEFDEEKNKIVDGTKCSFKKDKDVTRFPVGMIVNIETDGKRFAFGKAKWGKMWDDEEELRYMVLADRTNREALAVKRSENRLKKEVGEIWQDMTIKEARKYLAHCYGKDRTNALSLVLNALGL